MRLFAILLLSGCTTYNEQNAAVTAAWQAGIGQKAADILSLKVKESTGKKNELIWLIEQGSVLFVIGDIEESQNSFNLAERIINRYEKESKIKIGNETLALLSNQAALPYRGKAYDKIMVNTYKALNNLALSDPNSARVEFNRSLQRQKNAVAQNQKRIEAANEAAEQSNKKSQGPTEYDIKKARNDPKFSDQADLQMVAINERLLPYADYVNPFSVFLDGVFFSQYSIDASDTERALKSFKRVKGMSPGKYISEDCAMTEAMTAGAQAEYITYIIFATGSAPSLEQIEIDIPLFIEPDQIFYIGASFPRLEYHDDYIPNIEATTDGESYSSEMLCSMDAVISREFKNQWPIILTKTLLTTGTKAMTEKATELLTEDDIMLELITKFMSIAYQMGTNIADLRTWTTLPKKFAYIRMPTPKNGQFNIQIGQHTQTVNIVPKKSNMLIIRSINDITDPFLTQFELN